jgi:hypothetical protein
MHLNIRFRSYSHIIFAAAATLACACSPLTLTRAEAQSSTGNTYYVGPNGSDINSGSQASPFATIKHADNIVMPGDTVIVLDGTYKGDITLTKSGLSGNPITYKAQHQWKAQLVGTGTGDGSTVIGLTGAHIIIQDFDVTGSDANGIILASAGRTASYNQAISNYVHDMITPCDSNSGTAISTGGGADYSGISHNDIIGNLVVNITPFNGCPGGHAASGIYGQTPNAVIANNIVINAGTDIQTWHAATNMTIFGNTTIGGVIGITLGAGDSPGGITNDNSVVQNNISINSGVGLQEHGTTGTHNKFIDNLVFNNSTNVQLINGDVATGTVTADPRFVNNTGTAAGDYQLQSNSPAIGAGLALDGITTDYDGISRPQTGTTDIGACVSAGTSTPPTGAVAAGISASATSITSGQSSVLTWGTTNAVKATLNGTAVALNGSMTVSPTATTTYQIVATSSTGATNSGSVTVTVSAAPTGAVAAGISASATSIASGQSSVITWGTKNAVKATLNGAAVALNGSMTVSPTATTAYKIVGTSSTGATDWGSVTVTVSAAPAGPVAAGISASATSITSGQSSVLTWGTRNAVKAALNGTTVALNGSITVKPTATTTYKIVGTSSTGATDWGSVTVTVH